VAATMLEDEFAVRTVPRSLPHAQT
jgi:hypothetical protein